MANLWKKKLIGEKFFLIPCALGLSHNATVRFFVTKDDCGCSSIYLPKNITINHIIDVPIFSLSDFFDIFPFDSHPVIDYIKIEDLLDQSQFYSLAIAMLHQ